MPVDHGVTLPVADEKTIINLSRAMLDAHPVGNLAKPCALGLGPVFAAPLGLTEMSPEVATLSLVIPDQGVDPLMTDADARQGRHEATDLLWAPLLSQPVDNSGDHARQALRPLPGGATPAITEGLVLHRIVATVSGVAAQLATDRTAVEAQLTFPPETGPPSM